MYHQKQKAIKRYDCYNCNRVIEKGEEYGRTTIFPHEDPYISDWPYQGTFCKECFSYYEKKEEK